MDKAASDTVPQHKALRSRRAWSVLENLPIRSKIALTLILPVVAFTVLAAARVSSSVGTSRRAERVTAITQFSLAGTTLVHQLQRERGASMRYLVDRESDITFTDMWVQRILTGQALEQWRGDVEEVDLGALGEPTQDAVDDARARLDGLAGLRTDIDEDKVSLEGSLGYYNTTIASLLSANRELAGSITDPELSQAVSAFVTVSRIKELSALERGQVALGLQRDQLASDDFRRFTATIATRSALLADFESSATDAQRALYANVLVGPEVQRAQELRGAVVDSGGNLAGLDPGDWWWHVSGVELDLLRQVEDRLGADAATRSRAIERAASQAAVYDVILIVIVLLVAIGLSVVVGRSMLRRLKLLEATAQEVAHSRLPGLVEKLQRAEPVDLAVEARPIDISARDEIGQVARAFNVVHSVAVRVAAEQAALRRSIGDMFLNLGRRIQGLVHRQLELLDELERSEADPAQLKSLFGLDHLATRMRRNAENLVVLSGAEPVRRWSRPVPIAGIVRAARAEIEDYTRVDVLTLPEAHIAGHAVSDLVHLLAELIENAAAFSPPGTRVQVSGEPTPRGFLIEIEDRGIGMSDEELAEANGQLTSPVAIDFAVAQRLGFYVVGRLAARHGIKVRLRRSWFGGVTALVLLPGTLLGDEEQMAAGFPGDELPDRVPVHAPLEPSRAVRPPIMGDGDAR